MLTLEISNQLLEQRLLEKARNLGKTAQQIVEEMLADSLLKNKEIITKYPYLDPEHHKSILRFEIEESEITNDKPLFDHVTDTQTFAKELRKKAWQRNS